MANLTLTKLPTREVEVTSPGEDPYLVSGQLSIQQQTTNNKCKLYNSLGSFQFTLFPGGTDGVISVVEADATAHLITDVSSLYEALKLIMDVGDFSPSSLDLVLWLDARDTNAQIISTLDAVALLDKSENLFKTNTYTSDFSAGVDGFVTGLTTINGNIDGISDGTTSKDNCLEATLSGGAGFHQCNKVLGLESGKAYNIKASVLLKSSNVSADGIMIRTTTSLIESQFKNIKGTWEDIDFNYISDGIGGGALLFYALFGDANTGSADGDIFYITDIVINEINGNHFPQLIAANRGLVDNATTPTKVTFASANSEFLENTLDIASFIALSQGSLTFISDGSSDMLFTLVDSGVENKFIRFGISGSKVNFEINDGGTITLLNSTSNAIADKPVTISSDGSVITMFIDGVVDIVVETTGTNTGDWMDSIASVDGAAIGSLRKLTPTFSNTVSKSTIVTATPLTHNESLQLAKYLIAKHGL